jgi:OmpA-OmpF porin, OOP family
MKTFQRTAIFLASLMLCGIALAQGYVGVSAGQAKIDIDCSGTLTCDDTDNAYKIFGGYMFTPNYGIEGAYYNQGKVRQTFSDPSAGDVRATYKGDGLGVFGIGVLPFDRLSLFAKLGIVSSKIKLNANTSLLGDFSESDRSTKAAFGVGAGYEFTKNIGARFEFERLRVEFEGEKADVDLITVGVLYRF